LAFANWQSGKEVPGTRLQLPALLIIRRPAMQLGDWADL
jgi:hypothetical protein